MSPQDAARTLGRIGPDRDRARYRETARQMRAEMGLAPDPRLAGAAPDSAPAPAATPSARYLTGEWHPECFTPRPTVRAGQSSADQNIEGEH